MVEANLSAPQNTDKRGVVWLWENFELSICVFAMLCMTVLTFMNVVSRYVFGSSFGWVEEVCRFLIIWLTFGGSAYAFRMGAHIGIEALVQKLPPKGQLIAAILNNIATIIFFILLGYFGGQHTIQQYMNHQLAPVTRISIAFPYSAIPIGSALVILRLSVDTIQKIRLELKGA